MHRRTAFQILARSGYVARGIVFLLLAGLALFTGTATTKSALDSLLAQPLGQLWLGLIGLGLVGFVAWRLAQSMANADNHEQDFKGYTVRAMLFGSAVVYISLAYYSFDHAFGLAAARSSDGEKDLAGWAMAQPFGRYLAALMGLGFLIGGMVTIAKGVMGKYERYLEPQAKGNALIKIICVYGLCARGVLFAVAGVFFCYAAFTVDPQQTGSIADALTWLRQLPFGGILYVLAALGLFSFGGYNLIEGRYRIVRTPDLGEARKQVSSLNSPL
ncbi:DUF1206 domain-containing protein [Pararhizobium sp. YC-54]|uniref:DUF1206 domain-containing protein n=1 Tax=Pararhizobium sp. YC-54 TaxID=2986920 RepID=UPI0021F77965|nr:DUF1206 domain-containing protein [Pararhizobium sp. YC-54]MCV9999426.1 DUF1206 domain-containing protein [Pararhizobium sp. YC-54]